MVIRPPPRIQLPEQHIIFVGESISPGGVVPRPFSMLQSPRQATISGLAINSFLLDLLGTEIARVNGSVLAPNLGDGRIVEDIQEPVCGDPGPALGALQLVEVCQAPEQGRYLAAELDAEYVVDGELAT